MQVRRRMAQKMATGSNATGQAVVVGEAAFLLDRTQVIMLCLVLFVKAMGHDRYTADLAALDHCRASPLSIRFAGIICHSVPPRSVTRHTASAPRGLVAAVEVATSGCFSRKGVT